MTRAVVTQELVTAAADALVADAKEPTIILVQEHIGGGSYTTVKRYLGIWKAQRATIAPTIATPDTLATQGLTFVQSLWTTATALAEERVQQVQEEAHRQVEEARAALTAAEATIARLEVETDTQELALAHLRNNLTQARSAAQVAEARAGELAARLDDLKGVLAEAQREAAARAADTTALQLAAIKQQLEQQAATLLQLNGEKKT